MFLFFLIIFIYFKSKKTKMNSYILKFTLNNFIVSVDPVALA